jgi:hypothetical protein
MQKKLLLVCVAMLFAGCMTLQGSRQRFVNTHPALEDDVRDAILNGDIIAGMTPDMVRATWGQPVDEIKEVINGSNVTSWIYQDYAGSYVDIYRVRFRSEKVYEVKLLRSRDRDQHPIRYQRRHYYSWND